MNAKEIYTILGSNDAIIDIALLTGFIQVLRCSNFFENPLSSLCFAIIIAVIYSLFARLVIAICPDFLKPFISIILIASMIYYIFIKEKCDTIDQTVILVQNVQSENNVMPEMEQKSH